MDSFFVVFSRIVDMHRPYRTNGTPLVSLKGTSHYPEYTSLGRSTNCATPRLQNCPQRAPTYRCFIHSFVGAMPARVLFILLPPLTLLSAIHHPYSHFSLFFLFLSIRSHLTAAQTCFLFSFSVHFAYLDSCDSVPVVCIYWPANKPTFTMSQGTEDARGKKS